MLCDWKKRGLVTPFLLCYFALFTPVKAETTFAPNTVYDVCFTPRMSCERRLIQRINAATHQIDIQMYSFTSRNIAYALRRAYDRGVGVRILYDASNFDPKVYSLAKQLIHYGISCRIDDRNIRIAHNKVMIVDGEWVITGSYNFTYAAQHHNAENLLMIKSHELAQSYKQNFLNRLQRSRSCSR